MLLKRPHLDKLSKMHELPAGRLEFPHSYEWSLETLRNRLGMRAGQASDVSQPANVTPRSKLKDVIASILSGINTDIVKSEIFAPHISRAISPTL